MYSGGCRSDRGFRAGDLARAEDFITRRETGRQPSGMPGKGRFLIGSGSNSMDDGSGLPSTSSSGHQGAINFKEGEGEGFLPSPSPGYNFRFSVLSERKGLRSGNWIPSRNREFWVNDRIFEGGGSNQGRAKAALWSLGVFCLQIICHLTPDHSVIFANLVIDFRFLRLKNQEYGAKALIYWIKKRCKMQCNSLKFNSYKNPLSGGR